MVKLVFHYDFVSSKPFLMINYLFCFLKSSTKQSILFMLLFYMIVFTIQMFLLKR